MAGAVAQKPEIIYDDESDILRPQLQEKPSVESVEVAETDYESDGTAVAIEIDGKARVLGIPRHTLIRVTQ